MTADILAKRLPFAELMKEYFDAVTGFVSVFAIELQYKVIFKQNKNSLV